MTKRLVLSLATLLLTTAPVLADEDSDVREGETPQQRDDRLAAQAGHYAAGLRVHIASGAGDSFNFIGVQPWGRYNVSDSINVGARIPLAVSKPDGFAAFGGAMARAELRLGATIGAMAEVGFLKHFAVLLSDQDAPAYSDADGIDYDFAMRLGPWVRVKGGPVYLSFDPAFVYQAGDPGITGVQFPVTGLLRAGSVAHVGAQVGIYTGDDFKLGADEGGRVAAGLVADVSVSSIKVMFGAGFASLLTDDMALYTSVGKSVYVTVNLAYVK